ncbi:MAG: methyltransferase domain-containing protein, partial [Sedimentisphaerales bacterium]|nr:methyltransferase domain-containing protein [Sedimentisphaerales bacterium]
MKSAFLPTAPLTIATALLFNTAALLGAEIDPVARWLFAADAMQEQVLLDDIAGCRAELHGPGQFDSGAFPALMLDGQSVFLTVENPPESLLPKESLTLEAWVNLNSGLTWGGIVGYLQDNGAYEKGWLLGYNNTTFTVSVSTEGKLPYLAGKTEFRPEQWYHVVGTYDGDMLHLYVNGELESSKRMRGPIDYPEHAFFTIGAYKDDNEFFPLNGQLHEVALYAEALEIGQIRENYGVPSPPQVVPLQLELGPFVRYLTPSTAEVSWWTTSECASILEYGPAGPDAKYSPTIELRGPHRGSLDSRLEDDRPKKRHAMILTGLLPNEIYAYRIKVGTGDVVETGETYELDTALNYSVPPMPEDIEFSDGALGPNLPAEVCDEILSQTGARRGYCLVWGLVDGSLAYELAAHTELTVIGLDEDPDVVAAVRDRLYKAGVYGARISVHHAASLAKLPFPSQFANLVVSERMLVSEQCPGQAVEMARLLRPRGGAAVLCCLPEAAEAVQAWLQASAIDFQTVQTSAGFFYHVQKEPPSAPGSWTHQYGDAGNTADSGADLGGASSTDDLQVQWLGNPGADFGMDRNPRMPAPLAVEGKLFHQGMNRMVGVDSYNGTILWSLEIPNLRRVNLPRDASNWCTDAASLYVAVKEKCWVIEHYDGLLERVFELPPDYAASEYDWGYVARADRVLLGSAVAKNTVYTDFWGGDSWYDRTSGYGTDKVCSDALFAYNLDNGQLRWAWTNGPIINTTIAVSGETVFFVESRNEAARKANTRRLNDAALWSDQYLVALDRQTGIPRWQTPIDTADGIVVFFLACTDNAIVIASSGAGTYHLYKLDPQTGGLLWQASHNWPNNNHGGHMQHPVVFQDKVFLEPCGYDLQTGQRITSSMGRHEGCATYCGTKHALLYRGQSRRIALWDIASEKVTSWYNLRPSCWLSTIAAEGMVLLPEGGGGCSCGNWLETSLAFAPVERPTSRRPPPSRTQANP